MHRRGVRVHEVGDKVGDARVGERRVAVVALDKLGIAEPEDGRQDAEDGVLLLGTEADNVHRALRLLKVGDIVNARDVQTPAGARVRVRLGALETKLLCRLARLLLANPPRC